MDRQTRLAHMVRALGNLATSGQDGDFLIFTNLMTSDYVQFMRVPLLVLGAGASLGSVHVSLPLTDDPTIPKAQWEVTDRGLYTATPSSGQPPLSLVQIAAIEARGFRRRPHPNFTVYIDLAHVESIDGECEMLFGILGSAADFDLDVSLHT